MNKQNIRTKTKNIFTLREKISHLLKSITAVAIIFSWLFSPLANYLNLRWAGLDISLAPRIQEAQAVSCEFGSDTGGEECRGTLTTTGSVLQWSVPGDWSDANLIEVIGGGGAGGYNTGDASAGGGGGAYAYVDNLTGLSGNISYRVGSGGSPSATQTTRDGGDTWFNHATACASASVCAGGGSGGTDETPAGAGGTVLAGTGSSGGSGGTSGTGNDDGGGGGGGAAGPGGAGGNGGSSSGDGGSGG